mmetsp:Transcript_101541/g.160571  ORF Transcript_101541/g.160571 Transcript_101541/m.160571 type:complete len:217 (+) Transcript_101541:1367-2017(+)
MPFCAVCCANAASHKSNTSPQHFSNIISASFSLLTVSSIWATSFSATTILATHHDSIGTFRPSKCSTSGQLSTHNTSTYTTSTTSAISTSSKCTNTSWQLPCANALTNIISASSSPASSCVSAIYSSSSRCAIAVVTCHDGISTTRSSASSTSGQFSHYNTACTHTISTVSTICTDSKITSTSWQLTNALTGIISASPSTSCVSSVCSSTSSSTSV